MKRNYIFINKDDIRDNHSIWAASPEEAIAAFRQINPELDVADFDVRVAK
jgi:hypothetical protein